MDQSLDDLIEQDSRNSRKRNNHSGNRNRNFQNNRGYRDNNNYDGSRSRNSYRESRSSHGRHGRHGNRYDNDNNNYHDYNNNSNDYYNNRDNSRSYRNRHRNNNNQRHNNDNYNGNDDYRFDDMNEFNDFDDEPPRKRARTNTYRQRYNNYNNNNNNNNRYYGSNNNNRNDNGYYNDNRNEMPLSHKRQSPWIWHAANNRNKEKEDKNELLKRMINGGTFAYATLVMKGDGYVGGALMLGYSLKLTKTKYKLIVMVTNDVSKDARNALSLIYDYVIEVPFIEYSAKEVKKLKTEKQAEKYNTWMCASFTKWNVLQLNELITNENNGYESKEGEIEDSNGIENEKGKEKEKEKGNENESKEKSKESNENDHTTEGESNENENENENDNGNDIATATAAASAAAAQSNDKEKENENDDSEGKEKTEANDESSKIASKEKSDCNENEEKKDSNDTKRKESQIDTIGGPFDRILFLDSDKVVISNIDDIFLSISQCPAGTFSSPWACHGTRARCKYSQRGINDFYNEYRIIENDIIPRECLYDGLMNNGFVAVGTGMLFEPNIDDYNKFVKMLANGEISDTHAKYNKEKLLTQERQSSEKSKENENKMNDNKNREIGFSNCYSMSDEQTIVYYYFSQGKDWSYIDVRYNFIPWKFEWLDHDCLINEDCVKKLEPIRPFVLHFFGGKPWVQSPSNYGDLQSWWSLAYHLLNKSDICVKNEENCKLLKKFFEFKYLNELPIIDKEKSENENEQGNDKKRGNVECFWCKEKRPRNDDRKNHYSFSPLTGKWCDNLANGIKHVAQ